MSAKVTVYIARPDSERGRWRVTCTGRPVQEMADREDAINHAIKYARCMEVAGTTVVIRLERPDGSWVVHRD